MRHLISGREGRPVVGSAGVNDAWPDQHPCRPVPSPFGERRRAIDCPSSKNLRLIGGLCNGVSGPTVGKVMLPFGDASSGSADLHPPPHTFSTSRNPLEASGRLSRLMAASSPGAFATPPPITPPAFSPPAHAVPQQVGPPWTGSHSVPSRAPCHSTRHGNLAQRQGCWYRAKHE